MDANPFATALDTAAAARPRHPYLVPMDGPAISFADFADQCRAWAASLQGLGCGSGQRVALLMDNRPEYVLAWYASQLTGATVVSLNPMLPEDSQRHLLRLTSPRVPRPMRRRGHWRPRASRSSTCPPGVPIRRAPGAT
jgi:acyl-CoA synthetase (AMP-forming)/AMP-acid ligase II